MLVRLAQPAIVCCFWVLPHEGVIDGLITCEYLAVHLALVVVPNFATRSRKDSLDREEKPHLFWLENAALRIDEWGYVRPRKEILVGVLYPVKWSCTVFSLRTCSKAATRIWVSRSFSFIKGTAYP